MALDASEKKDKEAQSKIADLGQRLNLALAQKVQELTKYRSDFFGKLREILGNRPDMRIVGDRFVLQSELFFDTGKADLKPEATAELDKVAGALVELEKQIPADIAWVLRVDGHTDVRPIRPAGNSSRTGTCRRRARLRWCNIWSARASRRSAWSPPASANSSRSTPAPPRTPTGATAASSSS